MASQVDNCCVNSLWEEYYNTKNLETRNKLVEAYLWLVEYIARGFIKAKLPNFYNSEDLISIGNIGLIRAIEKFPVFSGVGLERYCKKCIRNAIIDEFRRKSDRILRLAESNEDAINSLCYDEGNNSDLASYDFIELFKDDSFNSFIVCLNQREQFIVTLYYVDDYQMWKIGKVLGITEGHVSRIHSRALQKIKNLLIFRSQTQDTLE